MYLDSKKLASFADCKSRASRVPLEPIFTSTCTSVGSESSFTVWMRKCLWTPTAIMVKGGALSPLKQATSTRELLYMG